MDIILFYYVLCEPIYYMCVSPPGPKYSFRVVVKEDGGRDSLIWQISSYQTTDKKR